MRTFFESEFPEVNFSFVDAVRKSWPGLGGAKRKRGEGT